MTPCRSKGAKSAVSLGGGAGGLPRLQAVQAALEVGVEPTLDGAWGDAQVSGDVLMGPPPLGQQDDPGVVAQAAVVGVPKGVVQGVEFVCT